jgi:hypothetical protein
VAVGSHPAQLQFLEPELSFEYVATPPPDRTIRVRFSHAASPGGSSRWSRFGEGYPVDFTISPPQLEAVTEELNAALRAFPPRGKLPARCFLL